MDYTHILRDARRQFEAGHLVESAQLCRKYLRLRPADPEAARLYGRIAVAMDTTSDAVVIFEKLLAMRPRDSDALEQLAIAYDRLGDVDKARSYAERALAVNERAGGALLALGSIELSRGDEERGRALLERARDAGVMDEVIDTTIAQELLQKGRFDEGLALARRLIAASPDHGTHYARLARSKTFEAGDPDASLVLSLLEPGGQLRPAVAAEGLSAVDAYLALYKMESDLENYEQAFEYLALSKEARLRDAPESAGDQAAQGQNAHDADVFTAEFAAQRRASACQDDSPIFVVGMPRSGTTLLERVLATNEAIAPAGELSHLGRILQEVCARVGKNQFDIKAMKKVPDTMWAQIGAEYVKRARASLPECRYFVDKMPGNFSHIGFIKAALPKARIIHLYRHPIATCFSIFEQNFGYRHGYNASMETLAKAYLTYHEDMAHWRKAFPGGFAELSYESLVSKPEQTIEHLSESLGLVFDLGVLNRSQEGGEIRTASYWQARQPINARSVARWEHFREQLAPLINGLQPILPG
ncbi:MAG: sulfotransferase [Pseudomonadota bacterium]